MRVCVEEPRIERDHDADEGLDEAAAATAASAACAKGASHREGGARGEQAFETRPCSYFQSLSCPRGRLLEHVFEHFVDTGRGRGV